MDAFSSLGNALSGFFTNPNTGGFNWGNLLKSGLGGFGLIGNILSSIKQNQATNAELSYLQNPAKLASAINATTQPLSTALTQDVGNQVQGYLAERGLATSPTIAAATEAQALAPYQLQEQQLAEQGILGTLNPFSNRIGSGATDMGSLMKLFWPSQSVQMPNSLTNNVGDLSVPFVGPMQDYNFADIPYSGFDPTTLNIGSTADYAGAYGGG